MKKWLLAALLLWAVPALAGSIAPSQYDCVLVDGACVSATGGVPLPVNTTAAGSSVANQASADSVSNLVFTAPNKQLFSLSVKIGTTSGYAMIFDAASLPANGAVTPKWCWPVNSNGTNGAVGVTWTPPLSFTTGITAGFSTTGCDTLTASTTAKFMGQAN